MVRKKNLLYDSTKDQRVGHYAKGDRGEDAEARPFHAPKLSLETHYQFRTAGSKQKSMVDSKRM